MEVTRGAWGSGGCQSVSHGNGDEIPGPPQLHYFFLGIPSPLLRSVHRDSGGFNYESWTQTQVDLQIWMGRFHLDLRLQLLAGRGQLKVHKSPACWDAAGRKAMCVPFTRYRARQPEFLLIPWLPRNHPAQQLRRHYLRRHTVIAGVFSLALASYRYGLISGEGARRLMVGEMNSAGRLKLLKSLCCPSCWEATAAPGETSQFGRIGVWWKRPRPAPKSNVVWGEKLVVEAPLVTRYVRSQALHSGREDKLEGKSRLGRRLTRLRRLRFNAQGQARREGQADSHNLDHVKILF